MGYYADRSNKRLKAVFTKDDNCNDNYKSFCENSEVHATSTL